MPEPKSHAQNRGALESMLRHIPGFRGYLEKSYRRESDALERQYLAERLARAKPALDDYGRLLLGAGRMAELPAIDHFRGSVDKLMARIRGAMQGYSGMFDLVEIDEKLLDRVYEHDVALMVRVETLGEGIEKLASSTVAPSETLPPLTALVAELEHAWDQRTDLLRGLE